MGRWYSGNLHLLRPKTARLAEGVAALSRRRVLGALAILMALMFSKFVYLASLGTYFTFYLIHKFGVSVQAAQIDLFVFLASGAVGDVPRRPDRRQDRPQAPDLGVDPGRAALHPGVAGSWATPGP